jgi:hypothetical protein
MGAGCRWGLEATGGGPEEQRLAVSAAGTRTAAAWGGSWQEQGSTML